MLYRSISSIALCEEAKKLWLEVEVISTEKNLFYVTGNGKSFLFKSTDFGGNSALGYKLADDKELSYRLLEKHWFPIAKSVYISKADLTSTTIEDDISALCFPLVIKPVDEWHGNGVMMNIHTGDELRGKLTTSFQTYDAMIVQEQIVWDEVRVLVMQWEVILALNRIPAHVVGNGKSTIEELIAHENKSNPMRWTWYEMPLSNIAIDAELISYLAKQWKEMCSIPDSWAYVQLRWNSNLWTWWTINEVTKELCDDIKHMCIEVSKLFGLEIAWIDILTSDFSVPLEKSWWVILEINPTPGIWWHKELTSVNSWYEILKRLFTL